MKSVAQKPASLANAAHGAWNCGRPKAASDLADLVESMGGIDMMDVIRVADTNPRRAAQEATDAQPSTRERSE